MKQAIQSVAPLFSMRRMVKNYVTELYMPARKRGQIIDADGYVLAKKLAAWKREVRAKWDNISVEVSGPREGQLAVGQPISVQAVLRLGELKPTDVRVELVVARDEDSIICDRQVLEMRNVTGSPFGKEAKEAAYSYTATIAPSNSGSLIYGVRVVPYHSGLEQPYSMGLAHWA